MKKYGALAIGILEEIGKIAAESADVMDAMLVAGTTRLLYASVHQRFVEVLRENHDRRDREIRRKKIFQTFYRLKRDGLIASDKNHIPVLTKRGLRVLNQQTTEVADENENEFPSFVSYQVRAIPGTMVIIFDIPEKERRKRAWLRKVIKKLGFSMAQKSVWIGKVAIPEKLWHDLGSLALLPFVRFFTIDNEGNIGSDLEYVDRSG
jgi:hypothetical protein